MSSGGPTKDAPVCVLGMGRSGTSLTTRIVGMLGVQLGSTDTMLPANAQDNPHGYWEQTAIRELNDDLLAEFGGTWSRPPAFEEGWHHEVRLGPLKQRAREVVKQEFAGSSRWGWKDPRASLTLPFWREIIGDMRYVICFRNPADVAASLLTRDPELHPREETLTLWLRYLGEALSNTAGEHRLLISYEDWFDRPEWQLERLDGFLSNRQDAQKIGCEREALAFLDQKARHHESQATELENDASVPADVRLFYLALRHLVADRSGVELDVGLQVLTEWWETRDDLWAERDQLRLQLASMEAQLDTHRKWLTSIQSSLSWRGTAFLRHLKRSALVARRNARR